MADFQVRVRRVASVTPHPNADRLDLVKIDGYTCVCQKGLHREGNLVIYIPEQALLPQTILEMMGFWKDGKGTLGGPKGNVVKPVKLRGILSQGLVMPLCELSAYMKDNLKLGDDVTYALDITKYEPPIPESLAGSVESIDIRFNYDIEDVKKYPDVLQPGEDVMVTEKLHGSLGALIFTKGSHYVTSKGLLKKGQVFTKEVDNVYIKAISPYITALEEWLPLNLRRHPKVDYIVFGEVYGPGIQDLHYSLEEPKWAIFDIAVRVDNEWRFMPYGWQEDLNGVVPIVPALYQGPWSPSIIDTYVNHQRSTKADHVREGVVIKTVPERNDNNLGRVILKSINPDYLTRKGGTEYQ